MLRAQSLACPQIAEIHAFSLKERGLFVDYTGRMIKHTRLAAAALAGLSISAVAAPKWEEMDYGRFLTASYDNTKGENTLKGKGITTNKGIAIQLGAKEAGKQRIKWIARIDPFSIHNVINRAGKLNANFSRHCSRLGSGRQNKSSTYYNTIDRPLFDQSYGLTPTWTVRLFNVDPVAILRP